MAWIDSLFQRMVELDASDLHMTSDSKPMLRVQGDIFTVDECQVISRQQMAQILLEFAPDRNRTEFEKDGDTDFAYELPGVARFRCNLFQDLMGPGGVFRLIPEEILTAEQLGLPQVVSDFCYMSKGLVVVTGPAGCGKSTTLAAMIDLINKTRAEHIVTIEDPIEFVHPKQKCLIHQRQVGRHTASFKRALRAALRQDPDIILVGEMRDLETIEIALETAETGHLVFGTLHTTTAPSTIDRIIDQFPPDRQAQIRIMLSGSLKGVVAQTLCKKKTGGRVAALEIMVVNNAIAAQIREGKTHQIISGMQMGAKVGMCLLNDSLRDLVASGEVDPAQAYMKSVYREDFLNKLLAIGIQFDPATLEAEFASGAVSAPQAGAAPTGVPGGGAIPMAEQQPAAAPPYVEQQEPPAAEPQAPIPTNPQGDPFEQFKQQQRGAG